MVYIASWQEFQEAAENLYEKSPNTARYCVKWKASEAKLVLKITDNTTCLKFKTYSSVYLNRFEALNLTLMRKMQNRKRPDPSTSSIPAAGDYPGTPLKVEGASPLPTQPAQGGGVKKKKTKKKK
jgi:signal recognition particle subunit SRP9